MAKYNIDRLDPNATFTLRCVHDDNMVVYVNGRQVIDAQGWTPDADNCTWRDGYETFNIPASAFVKGENVLGIYIQQNWGGAYFDCELIASGVSAGGAGVLGDVDGSGIVDVEDVNCALNLILKLKNIGDYSGNADMDGNGYIDVEDVNAIINIILKLD